MTDWKDIASEFGYFVGKSCDEAQAEVQRMSEEIIRLRAENESMRTGRYERGVVWKQLVAWRSYAFFLRDAIQKVYDDEETGHWGPDVTMKSVLEHALDLAWPGEQR